MRQAMYDVVLSIKAMGDQIEVLRIARIVTAKHRVRDMVRNLYKPRGP